MQILQILFENQDLVIINKPSGVDVYKVSELLRVSQKKPAVFNHPSQIPLTPFSKGGDPDSSLNTPYSLLYTGSFYLVHRIDQETSGCLVVAKTLELKTYFEDLFRDGKVDKEYITLVKGLVKQQNGEISFRLEGREKGTKVNALTRYRVMKRFLADEVTLLSVQILTGRMHQIRKHMAMIHHPVVMDSLHGDFRWNKIFRKTFGLKRLFLHAKRIGFSLPDGKLVNMTAPMSEDLDDVLKLLG